MNSKPESKPNASPDANLAAMDRILSTDEQLVPSSGFVSAVMECVREEAAVPPPIPFPWKRAIPGIALVAGVFGWGLYLLVRSLPQALQQFSFAAPQLSVTVARDLTQAGWIVFACALSLLSWMLSTRMILRSGRS